MKTLFIILLAILSFSCSQGDEDVRPMHAYEVNVIGGYIGDLTVNVGNKNKISTTNYTGGGTNASNNIGYFNPNYSLKIDTLAPLLKVTVSATDGGGAKTKRVRIELKKDGVVRFDTVFDYMVLRQRITINKEF